MKVGGGGGGDIKSTVYISFKEKIIKGLKV